MRAVQGASKASLPLDLVREAMPRERTASGFRLTAAMLGGGAGADRNDERVLRAAREVFAEHGWNAPVSEIARHAGMGMGSLYRRYPAKEDLAQALRVQGMNAPAGRS
ncbi:helix-turn-helix domain-containing protein [Streptomyces sp. NPDC006544]|uniref:helix-turn-helix domain-containing protein n=1 Tax=Streptomyces sp. NPDC006544 TaxID=3154583 RepID=UPI0033B1767F